MEEVQNNIPIIEITTVIGCKIQCVYCPQNRLIRKYIKKVTSLQCPLKHSKIVWTKYPNR